MARVLLLFLLSNVLSYGGHHLTDFLPEAQRNWLVNIIDNLQGKAYLVIHDS